MAWFRVLGHFCWGVSEVPLVQVSLPDDRGMLTAKEDHTQVKAVGHIIHPEQLASPCDLRHLHGLVLTECGSPYGTPQANGSHQMLLANGQISSATLASCPLRSLMVSSSHVSGGHSNSSQLSRKVVCFFKVPTF